ncbi:MAG: Hpt domain-containing protein [Phoenicibacter congonensis]|uniref:Hpt domain-containing protein n=1 Tax=Phoenicibacter congonensis TaxID=1944646 RepID=A0AA43UBM7_9ACTN|nr:Hpt domain-containing protein [Phoenicibacter congonensis]
MNLKRFYDDLGQDYQTVLERVMGKEDFLDMMLHKFTADSTINRLEEAVGRHEAPEIFNQAHTMKGVAENLGLKPLYDKVSVLVEITRGGSVRGVDEAFAQVKQTYAEIIKALETTNSDQ